MSASRHVLSFLYLSPRSHFPTGQRFPIPKHVTSTFPVTSGSGDVISGHFRSCAFPLSPQAPLSNQNGQRLPFRLATARTNQKPGKCPIRARAPYYSWMFTTVKPVVIKHG